MRGGPFGASSTHIAIAACVLLSSHGIAGVTTDGRVGPIQSLSGQMTIPQDLGTAVGPNLFHSFSTFNIDAGESATFTSVNPFNNVISRVTGGAPSGINGPLISTVMNGGGGGANFWFINPAGIVFGAGASAQVPGAFHASTADFLKLGNCGTDPASCGQFNATDPDGSSLTVAPPASFGFLGPAFGPIEVNGTIFFVPLGAAVSLTGGDISVTGGIIYAQSGSINLTSVDGPGEIPADPADPGATVTQFGNLSLSGTTVLADGLPGLTRGGRVFIRGGTVLVDTSEITSNHSGSETGGGITIIGTDAIRLASGSKLEIVNSGTGNPGSVTLGGGDVSLTGASTIVSQGRSAGPGASLAVSGADIRMDAGSRISSSGFQRSAGDITITATGSVSIDGAGPSSAGVSSAVLLGTSAAAGSITVDAGGSVALISGALLASQTSGTGDAGNLNVTAGDILIDGTLTPDRFTGITSQTAAGATGNAGAVTLNGDTIRILGTGEVSSNTFSGGSAGSVAVTGQSILIDGTAGATDTFTGISSGSEGGATGNAGTVTVNGQSTTLLGRGVISSNTAGSGTAGTVTVSSATLLIDGRDTPDFFTGISSDSTVGATGNAGAVAVSGDSITILGGGHVSSTTAGTGAGGQVTLSGGTILIDGTGVLAGNTDVSTRSLPGAAANAGGITVLGDSIALRGGGEISSSTFNSGDAGRVLVSSGTILIDGTGAPARLTGIFSQSNTGVAGNAGAVTVQGDQITILSGGVISTNTDGTGNAGDITVNSETDELAQTAHVTVSGAGSGITSASTGTGPSAGKAGNVTVTTGTVTLDQRGQIAATTVDGAGGAVTLNADTLKVNSGAQVNVATSGSGNAGDVLASGPGSTPGNATRSTSVTVSGAGSGIISNTSGTGDGGAVTVVTSSLEVVDGGTVSAASAPAAASRLGRAGSILADATDLTLLSGGSIRTTSATSGGGNIQVRSTGNVLLQDGAITASAQGLQADDSGGNVTISRPQFLVLNRSEIRADANAGRGGNILIDTNVYVASADSVVSASSEQSVDGQITNTASNTVTAPADLPAPDSTLPEPIRNRCIPEQIKNRSSLVVRRTRPMDVRSPYPTPSLAANSVGMAGAPCGSGAVVGP